MDFMPNCKKIILSVFLLVATVSVFSEIKQATHEKGNSFYQSLVAELYNQLGEPALTLDYYLPLALKSSDANLVKRVTEIATGSAQLKKGLRVAQHWVELSPKDIEARQYLTLLLLRDNQLRASAKQLFFVRDIIEESENTNHSPILVSKGLTFIGALLVGEAHHNKAYRVFEYYIKEYGRELNASQQKLILASLAMKAKKYQAVVSAIENVDEKDALYRANVGLMKSKALQKLGRLDEAAELIKQIINTDETSDSLRLELSRLLIRVGKKDEASQLLSSLVTKYPDNNDLLKSLIALNINQKQWLAAKRNNKQLSKTQAYLSDANYFYGEISEAENSLKKALSFFKDVEEGSFVKRSHGKVASLIARINSIKEARNWLQENQKKSIKRRDKIHWLKLEAKLLTSHQVTTKRLKEAVDIYSHIISFSPKKNGYYYFRGLVYEKLGHVALAENDFKYVLTKKEKHSDALNALGYLLLKHTTRFEEAKGYIQSAYNIKPNDPTIMDSLGWVYYKMGKHKLAEKYLRKAFKFSQSQDIVDHLVAVLVTTGQQQAAKVIREEMNEELAL